MHIVKSVGVMSVAKIMGMIYACMGLLVVPFFLLAGVVGLMAGQEKTPLAGIFGIGFGIGFALVAPVLYGVMGFIFGAITAFLYNLCAGWAGGFELELDARPSASAPYRVIPPPAPGV